MAGHTMSAVQSLVMDIPGQPGDTDDDDNDDADDDDNDDDFIFSTGA